MCHYILKPKISIRVFILTIIVIINTFSVSHASLMSLLGGPTLKLFNKTVSILKSNIERLSNEVGVIKDNMVNLEAKIVGFDKSIRNEIKSGRDSINTTNDTGLMKYITAILASALIQSYIIILYLLASQRMNNKAKNKLIARLACKDKEIEHIKKNGVG